MADAAVAPQQDPNLQALIALLSGAPSSDSPAPAMKTGDTGNASLDKTLKNIQQGIPAPPMNWQGQPIGNVQSAISSPIGGIIGQAEQKGQEYATKYGQKEQEIAQKQLEQMQGIEAKKQQQIEQLGPVPEVPHMEAPKPMDISQMPMMFSVMAAIGALAGSTVKGPLNASLENMTGVLQGMKEGDHERMNRELAQLKQNHQEAMDKLNVYNTKLKNILDQSKGDLANMSEKGRLEMLAAGMDKNLFDYYTKHPEKMYELQSKLQNSELNMLKVQEQLAKLEGSMPAAGYKPTVYTGKDGKQYTSTVHKDGSISYSDAQGNRVDPNVVGYPPEKGQKSSQAAAVRTNLVVGAAKNALNRYEDVKSVSGEEFPRATRYFKLHPEGFSGLITDQAYSSLTSSKEKQTDKAINSFVDEIIPVLTGGLRGSDSFRRFILNQVPSFPRDDKKSAEVAWKSILENVRGMKDQFRQQFASDPSNWGKGVTKEEVDSMMHELSPSSQKAPDDVESLIEKYRSK